MSGDGLADAEAIGKMTGRDADTIRSWASRYPELLPRRGKKGRRVLYAVKDAEKLAPLADARAALTIARLARHT